MALAKYANKRDRNEKPIVKMLRGVGATVYQLDRPCDYIVGFRGVNYLLEFKEKGGALTPAQEEFREHWEGQYAVCWTDDQALHAIGAI